MRKNKEAVTKDLKTKKKKKEQQRRRQITNNEISGLMLEHFIFLPFIVHRENISDTMTVIDISGIMNISFVAIIYPLNLCATLKR